MTIKTDYKYEIPANAMATACWRELMADDIAAIIRRIERRMNHKRFTSPRTKRIRYAEFEQQRRDATARAIIKYLHG